MLIVNSMKKNMLLAGDLVDVIRKEITFLGNVQGTGIVNTDLNYIDFAAEMCNVSREVISMEEYERRFNKKFEFYQ